MLRSFQRPTRQAGSGAARASHGLSQHPLIHWFCERAAADPHGIAFRYKALGIWPAVRWDEFRSHVELFALGLRELGVGPGDPVVILAGPGPDALYADLAVQSLGALSTALNTTGQIAELRHLLDSANARAVIVENQEQLERLQAARIPDGSVIVFDTEGIDADTPGMLSFSNVEALGRVRAQEEPALWSGIVSNRSSDEVSLLCATAGTTGEPKLVMLSSRNVIEVWGEALHGRQQPDSTDRIVGHLPLAHIFGRVACVVLPVLYGCTAYLPETEDLVREAMREVSPTILLTFSKPWERQASQVLVEIATSDRVKRRCFWGGLSVRRRLVECLDRGDRPSLWLRFGAWLAYMVSCRPMLDKFGYADLRIALASATPLSVEVSKFWHMLGVGLVETYGLTESAGLAAMPTGRGSDGRSVGQAVNGIALEVSTDGEVLISGAGVSRGYWQDPSQPLTPAEGRERIHTGDIGEMDRNGSLTLLGRRAFDSGLSVPDRRSVGETEQALLSSPFILYALSTLTETGEIAALIGPDSEALAEWARARGQTYASFSQIGAEGWVLDLIQREVDAISLTLRQGGGRPIASFSLLPQEFSPESGDEITYTGSLKRGAILARYGTQRSALRADAIGPAAPGASEQRGSR